MAERRVLRIGLLLFIKIVLVSYLLAGTHSTVKQKNESGFQIKLSFENVKYEIEKGEQSRIIFPDAMDESQPGSLILPHKIIYIALPPNDESEITFINKTSQLINSVIPEINPQWEIINDSTIHYKEAQLSIPTLQASSSLPDFTVMGYTWIRNFYVAVVKINIAKFSLEENTVELFNSIELKVTYKNKHTTQHNTVVNGDFDNSLNDLICNYDNAKEFFGSNKIHNSDESQWIDFGKDYVKLSIHKDGIYRILYNDLVSYGIDPSIIHPTTFKLFVRGKQLPLYISGEEDGVFNKEDFIEFYCRKNYELDDYKRIVNTGQQYVNYLNKYVDSTYAWLTWNGEQGQRTKNRNSSEKAGLNSLSTHRAKIHLESDERLWYYSGSEPRYQLPIWSENKVYTWLFFGSPGSISAKFNAENIVQNSSVNFTSRLLSNASNVSKDAHKVGFALNSSTASDTIKFDFKSIINFNVVSSSNLLKEGSNQINIYGYQTFASINQVLLDWIDVTYSQHNVIKNDTLHLRFDDLSKADVYNIIIKNVEDVENIQIYRLTPTYEKIIGFSKDAKQKHVVFSDTVKINSSYYISGIKKIRKAKFIYKKRFSDLLNNANGADYILISNLAFSNSTQDYEKFIKSNYSIRTYTAYINEVYDQFTFGYPEPEAIKKFLIGCFSKWKAPLPSYLILLGDANYDYKTLWKPLPAKVKTNFVPTYGQPASDNWFCTFDSVSVSLPQMFVGRLPVQNDDQLNAYLNRHKNYLNRKPNILNKKFILFSGGDPKNPNELSTLKTANDLLQTKITDDSISGIAKHFFKTTNPLTNFGPISHTDYQATIDSGALAISYSGHSGTRTWDNGINEVKNLKNLGSIYPLISDFGCSTGRFAEPDVDSFGELFVSQSVDGQAIGYLGNSNLGFLSTAAKFPSYFFSELFNREHSSLGSVHFRAKVKQMVEGGYSEVTRAFNYCNLLFADPIIKIAIPTKPNLTITQNDIRLLSNTTITDIMDSVKVRFKVTNLGRGTPNKFNILVTQELNGKKIFFKEIMARNAFLFSYYECNIPIKNNSGNNLIKIELDKDNSIDELFEDDNNVEYSFYVASDKTKTLLTDKYFLRGNFSTIKLLNPHSKTNYETPEITLSFAGKESFQDHSIFTKKSEIVTTSFILPELLLGKRYWFRTMLRGTVNEWSETYSFIYDNNSPRWSLHPSAKSSNAGLTNVICDSIANGWILSNALSKLVITSAGSSDGKYASITLNNTEKLTNTFFWGIAAAILDTVTLIPADIRYFTFPASQSSITLTKYINELPKGTTIIMVVCDDAAQSVLGFDFNSDIRKLIETSFGSIYSRKVGYRESWCMISKKGATYGTALETYKKQFEGLAIIDKTKSVQLKEGYILTPLLTNVSKWKEIGIEATIPVGALIEVNPISINKDGKMDTLKTKPLLNKKAKLDDIDEKLHPNMQFLIRMKANETLVSPLLKTIDIDFTGVPELATNYQVVSISKDSLDQGEKVNLNFAVYNVGESTAANFKVRVDLVKKDNSKEKLFEQVVDSIQTENKKDFRLAYTTDKITGSNQFQISIDPENKVTELYKDNNFYSVPFYVKPNNKPASIKLTIDGTDILNGDFISSKPNFKIELNDESLIPITDTSKVLLYLNNKRIFFADNLSTLSYSFSSNNPKMAVNYNPTLADGNYTFKVVGKNATDQIIDSTGIVRKFTVKNQLHLLNAYNYPNPFKGETYFTFKITQLPDELKILIYTIAGRKIKEIKLSSSDLRYDFNRIYWDGRDNDGDILGNGVYIYKIISKKGNEKTELTQKLSILR
ncbi:MAG: Uncharacterized protein FD143_1330 [Ignavibacteria bacterium]|nr:MAG: Uncharacterized protein FD143_1330 [Ignavibacteria bacterium]KAF0160636.1 MAG: Uncharacterized protein FD188_1543 [Ignavibacteria bacterium]